jgi:hypothetical protein
MKKRGSRVQVDVRAVEGFEQRGCDAVLYAGVSTSMPGYIIIAQ